MRGSQRLLAFALTVALAGCESIFGPGDGKTVPLTELPRALSASEQEVIGASNRFAFDLLRETSARDTASNVFLSPLSASMALGMTMNGARGETFTGMRGTLGFGALDQNEINASYRSLIDLLLGLDTSVDVRLANSTWVHTGFPLHDSFVQSSRKHFDATVAELDFKAPAAVKTINSWASRSTEGKIKTILEEIPANVVMYLMNAIYFKGSWTRQFDPKLTREAAFHREDGGEQRVRMMHLRETTVRHLRTAEAEMIELPYGREAFSMTVVLPAHGGTLEGLVASLNAQTWSAWMDQLTERRMDVFLPRFRLEYEKVLNETLKALGMEIAFSPGSADFTGMSRARGLYIDEVKQKSFIEVNEEGTEAAAVTSVAMALSSGPPPFRADRPFLVVIRERLSGTILFIGAVGAPPSE
jgi:serine protease inhibitor